MSPNAENGLRKFVREKFAAVAKLVPANSDRPKNGFTTLVASLVLFAIRKPPILSYRCSNIDLVKH